jgi:hypothetical protein
VSPLNTKVLMAHRSSPRLLNSMFVLPALRPSLPRLLAGKTTVVALLSATKASLLTLASWFRTHPKIQSMCDLPKLISFCTGGSRHSFFAWLNGTMHEPTWSGQS